MRRHNSPKGVIFDLGDVLFTWSPNTSTGIPRHMMRNILSSAIWMDFECGYLEQDACFHQIAQHFLFSPAEVAEAFSQARDSLQPNSGMMAFIRNLKQQSRDPIEIYAMSNISNEDSAVLSTKIPDWSIFDQVFTSGHAGMRKPDPRFYLHVLQEIHLSPEDVFFIDDKLENVLAAKSLGIDGHVFDNNVNGLQALGTIFHDPIAKAFQYLYRCAPHFESITETGVDVPDNFAQLLILDTMQDQYASQSPFSLIFVR